MAKSCLTLQTNPASRRTLESRLCTLIGQRLVITSTAQNDSGKKLLQCNNNDLFAFTPPTCVCTYLTAWLKKAKFPKHEYCAAADIKHGECRAADCFSILPGAAVNTLVLQGMLPYPTAAALMCLHSPLPPAFSGWIQTVEACWIEGVSDRRWRSVK